MSSITEALDWLYSTQLFGMKLGLEHTARLLRACELSHLLEQTGKRPQVIHVAGTNGKGSSCAMMAAIGCASGYRTGLFTSPHLLRFNERARVNGQMIDDDNLLRLINKVHELTAEWDPSPTFFELTTAIALMYFEEQECELIILETGMGGRLDSTNTILKDVAVLMPIAMDHTQYLGSELSSIAREKAGIITASIPVISSVQEQAAMQVIQEACAQQEAQLQYISEPSELPLALKGSHQSINAAVACAAIQALPHFKGNAASIAHGLATTQWEGRFERVQTSSKTNGCKKELILDGAHNEHAMQSLVATWQQEFGNEHRPSCIFAAAADKDIEAVLQQLAPLVGRWILPQAQSPRLASAEDMRERVRRISEAPISCCEQLADAIEMSDEAGPTLLCGSLFLVGEMKSQLEQAEASYRKSMQ